MALNNSQMHFDIKVRQVTGKSFAMSTSGISVVLPGLALSYRTLASHTEGGLELRTLENH